jgi:predicted tellurium resistance membrane protein TerC
MLRKHRGFLTFMLTVLVFGVGLRLAWDVATGGVEPPIWVSALVAVAVVLIALQAEAWNERRLERRQRTNGAGR